MAAVPLAPSASSRAVAGISNTSQWANARGKLNSGGRSGSVTLIAKLRVPVGASDQTSRGERLFSSAKRCGMVDPAEISGAPNLNGASRVGSASDEDLNG